MRLEILDNKILIWETGRKENNICYDSTKEKSEYSRRNLCSMETFLISQGELEEANIIKKHLGKTIRNKSVPQLIPTGNYIVSHRLDALKGIIDRYKKEHNLDMNPDFQRGHVWNMDQRLRYVEFVLQGGKSNPIYFNCKGWMGNFDGQMVIVDGKQRLTSLLMFLNNEFPMFKELDTVNGVGFYAKEFDFIPNDIIVVINDLDSKEKVLEWYLQMNKGNVAHTEEELQRVEDILLSIRGSL